MTMNWSHLELPPSQWRQLSQESSQTGTRLFPLGDNFPELDQTTWLTKIAGPTSHETNQTTPVTELFNYVYILSPALSSFVYFNL
jgi:hypothetical protein